MTASDSEKKQNGPKTFPKEQKTNRERTSQVANIEAAIARSTTISLKDCRIVITVVIAPGPARSGVPIGTAPTPAVARNFLSDAPPPSMSRAMNMSRMPPATLKLADSMFKANSMAFPRIFLFFVLLFNLFLSFSWCSNNVEAEIFRLFKYEEAKKCGVKFRLKRPCFLMMDMNALGSLWLFMVENL